MSPGRGGRPEESERVYINQVRNLIVSRACRSDRGAVRGVQARGEERREAARPRGALRAEAQRVVAPRDGVDHRAPLAQLGDHLR